MFPGRAIWPGLGSGRREAHYLLTAKPKANTAERQLGGEMDAVKATIGMVRLLG